MPAVKALVGRRRFRDSLQQPMLMERIVDESAALRPMSRVAADHPSDFFGDSQR